MTLHQLLRERAEQERPIRVGVIGAGKFASMFLAQVPHMAGVQVIGIADLSVARAQTALARIGWPQERAAARSPEEAAREGTTWVGDDTASLIAAEPLDVVIDATGDPTAGVTHALAAFAHGKDVIMVNVEADALCGPALAERAARAGVVYSLAYGDQPALICELVDWARACGFAVTAAGKGTKYLPAYHRSTPDTVWDHYGRSAEEAERAGMNPRMFNSFLDGTKSAIEMAAVANATGLAAPATGLAFPPCGVDDLATVLRPEAEGGVLAGAGLVEVVSSLERDGNPVARDLRWGVYVVFEAPGDYTAACFGEYGLATDPTGRYAAMYKPYHLIGLELGISVASAALRRIPTGSPDGFRADAVAVAKRALAAGETLDGEGGHTVWGRLMPAPDSLALGAVPIGLAHGLRLLRPLAEGAAVRWADVAEPEDSDALRLRRETEARCGPAAAA
jgi:predicted homoserine dehydrogenase-like protein